jgi:hypothetical protein
MSDGVLGAAMREITTSEKRMQRVGTALPAGRGNTPVELTRDALTAPAGVSYDSVFEGVETKGLSVEEEALIAWQDVLDMVVNGRPNEVACPYCNHRPLTIEEIEQSTRISCSKCGKFIQGRFTH